MPILAGMSYRFPPHTIATATRRGRGDNTTLGQKHYNTKRYHTQVRTENLTLHGPTVNSLLFLLPAFKAFDLSASLPWFSFTSLCPQPKCLRSTAAGSTLPPAICVG